jgi:hypothetical protein
MIDACRPAIVVALLLLHPLVARAQSWDELARTADRIDGRALPALFWAQSASCDRFRDDMLRRQCLGIRFVRGVAASAKTFLLRAEAAALDAGAFDAARAGVPLTLRGCLACKDPIEVAGERRYVVVRGSVAVDGDGVLAAPVYRGLRRVEDDVAAARFKADVLPRLRAELIVRPTTKPETWTQGGRSGYYVELLGYRIYDPCDGSVLAASPLSVSGEVDGSTCQAEAAATHAPMSPESAEPPYQLSVDDVRRVLKDVNPAVYKCYDSYGVPGRADVYIDVKGDGSVRFVEVRGELADTPTGKCVAAAVKQAKFPRFQRDSMQVHYPFLLR